MLLRSSLSSSTPSPVLVFLVEFAVITAQRTLVWLSIWKTREVRAGVRISGVGKYGLQSRNPSPASLIFHTYRSVHNVRIERLWYDVTMGFGAKWKKFFIMLEVEHGLRPDSPAHIWLLHHLFLPAIRTDATEWVKMWNSHKISGSRQRERSPEDMFVFGMIEYGARGLDRFPDQDPTTVEPLDDPVDFGIDYEALDNRNTMDHFYSNNPSERTHSDPFPEVDTAPARMAHIPCEPPNCPFSPEDVAALDETLGECFTVETLRSRSMRDRCSIWVEALHLCHIMQEFYRQGAP